MKIKDIAKQGLKGRKKDTLLLKLVITLGFIFIVTSTIFEASIIKTKEEQRLNLYGEWHAAYLKGNEETLENLKSEKDIDKLGVSLIIGESEDSGVIGTFNEDLIDMGRFSLYKGRYPEAPNEIMLELNQMSFMNLDLEVGQKIQVAIPIQRLQQGYRDYIMNLNEEFLKRNANRPRPSFYDELYDLYDEREVLENTDTNTDQEEQNRIRRISEIDREISRIYSKNYTQMRIGSPNYYLHNEAPFEKIGDVFIVVSNNYFHYYLNGDEVNPEIIKENGLLTNSKVILKKEFIISGILQTYTDKWDLGGYKAPNAFITEEGGKTLTDAFYNNNIGDFSDYKMDYNIFLYSNSKKQDLYSTLAHKYPDMSIAEEEEEEIIQGFGFWISMYGKSEEEVEKAIEETTQWSVKKGPEEWEDSFLEAKDELGSKMEVNTSNFRVNNFSYPDDSGSTEYILTLTIIAVIFIAIVLAILQIFLTQMKRRSRKLVLLKSIGATNKQIIGIIVHEGLYLLQTGLFIGVPTGFIFAGILIFSMNNFADRSISFNIIPSLLIIGILAGCLALFVGMIVPIIYAIRIPLTGTMSKPPKHKHLKHKKGSNTIRTQSFRQINWQYFKLNKGKTFISFGISFIIITILLSTVLLCYMSFDNYNSTSVIKNRPDYAMETYYGESIRGIRLTEEDLLSIDGVESTEVYKVGTKTFLWYEGIDNNQMLKNFENLLPGKFRTSHFSKYNNGLQEYPEWINNAMFTKIYGINPDSELYTKYNSNLIRGVVDKKNFTDGEEVILLVPLYYSSGENVKLTPFDENLVLDATNEDNRMNWLFEQTDHYEVSYSSRYKEFYEKVDDIKPGDTIHLSVDKEEISGDSYIPGYRTEEFKVGGIIYYFDKQQVWPFSNNITPYAVIGSMNAMEKLYPNTKIGLGMVDHEGMRSMVNTLYPTKYGRTLWYINTNSKNKDVVLDSKLLSYANNNGYTLYNYKESKSELYSEAFNNALIIGLLGLTAASIASIILYNIFESKLEQNKNRIGILQSLGVSSKDFYRHYLLVGFANGLLAIILANLLLFIVILLTTVVSVSGIQMTFIDLLKDIFEFRLWQYPWLVHNILCILFLIVTVIMHYLPSRKIIQQSPVENIRALSR
ncbi:MAG: ABC transporter permease [Tissierellaceae bacterium]|nr:ABC transporter permease [Tissierellaceae bacterium]